MNAAHAPSGLPIPSPMYEAVLVQMPGTESPGDSPASAGPDATRNGVTPDVVIERVVMMNRAQQHAMRFAPPPGEDALASLRTLAEDIVAIQVRGTDAFLDAVDVVRILNISAVVRNATLSPEEVCPIAQTAWETRSARPLKWIERSEFEEPPSGRDSITQMSTTLLLKNTFVVDSRDNISVFALLNRRGAVEPVPLRSHEISDDVRQKLWTYYRKTATTSNLNDAISTAEAHARTSSPRRPIDIRIGGHRREVWIDLGGQKRRKVRINPDGYSVHDHADVLFYLAPGMEELPEPRPGRGFAPFRELFPTLDEHTSIVLATWMVASLIPTGPFPILHITGVAGSAKSTLTKILRKIIDPNAVPIRSLPKNPQDLMITAQRSWLLTFDNVSDIRQSISDALCGICYGTGFATRSLYTNRDETLLSACRPCIVNGITDVVTAPDLLSRAVTIDLPMIRDEQRITEQALQAKVEEFRPGVMHALFEALSLAMRTVDDIRLGTHARMADFEQWGAAMAPALGSSAEQFVAGYRANRAAADELALEASPIGAAIYRFMQTAGEWKGTCSELLNTLNSPTILSLLDEDHRRWPQSPEALRAALKRLEPTLHRMGLQITHDRAKDRKRARLLHLVATNSPPTSTTSSSHVASPREEVTGPSA